MTKYRYQVRSRCLNPLVQKPSEWVTHSWHMTKEGAERGTGVAETARL